MNHQKSKTESKKGKEIDNTQLLSDLRSIKGILTDEYVKEYKKAREIDNSREN